MTTSLLIGALILALVLAAAATAALVRVRASADQRVAEAVRRVAEGMQQTLRELADTFEQAQAERAGAPGGAHYVGELAATLDLDEVAERTLEAAGTLDGVDAALVEADGPEGRHVAATIGVDRDVAERAALRAPADENLRAVEVVYRYRIDDVDEATGAIRSGVVVPIRAEGGRIGTLVAFTRSTTHRLSDEVVEELERLAYRAGPALENARRYAEARHLADLDALTSLHNRRYFHETLGRECARAQRYGRKLALIVFDVDDFKAINDRIGHLAGDAVLAELAERVRTVVRSADVACRVGGDEFAVILPESGRADAELLAERIGRAIASRPLPGAGTAYVSAGIAELRPDDGAKELFERADNALYRAKEAGKARTYAANDTA